MYFCCYDVALIVGKILLTENLFFSGQKERPTEVPFWALKKKVFGQKIEPDSRIGFKKLIGQI